MVQKIDFKDMCFGIQGLGRVNENCPIDLAEYTVPYAEGSAHIPIVPLPRKIVVSKKISNTVYGVTANFDIDGKYSILQQFKKLILSQSQN